MAQKAELNPSGSVLRLSNVLAISLSRLVLSWIENGGVAEGSPKHSSPLFLRLGRVENKIRRGWR